MANKRLDKLEIIVGTVVDVQIIERELAAPPPPPPEPEPGKKRRSKPQKRPTATIIGRLRLFLDGPGAQDPNYDFDRCELPVRKDQEIAIARLPARTRRGAPVNVMLLNRSLDKPWPFDDGVDLLAPPPRIEVRTKALIYAIAAFFVLYALLALIFMREANAVWQIFWPLLGALVSYFVFWMWLHFYRGKAQEDRRQDVVDAVYERLKAAKAPPPPDSQPTPSPP